MFRIEALRQKLAVTAVVGAFVALMYLFEVPCAIKALTGFNCPGCGMTRATLAAIKFDFKSAFEYNRMFWSLPILYWCFLKDGRVFERGILNAFLYAVLITLFVANSAFC